MHKYSPGVRENAILPKPRFYSIIDRASDNVLVLVTFPPCHTPNTIFVRYINQKGLTTLFFHNNKSNKATEMEGRDVTTAFVRAWCVFWCGYGWVDGIHVHVYVYALCDKR